MALFSRNQRPVSGNRDHESNELGNLPRSNRRAQFMPQVDEHLRNTYATPPNGTLIFSSITSFPATLATECNTSPPLFQQIFDKVDTNAPG